jgi:serine/threonine protein kinase
MAGDGPASCPACGAPLVAGGPLGGLCAACLLGTAAEGRAGERDRADTGDEAPWQLISVMAVTPRGTTYLARAREREGLAVVRIGHEPWRPEGDAAAAFARRRAALLGLRHPVLAGVQDTGWTADGRLFVVRDYAAGVPLDQARRRHALTAAAVARVLAPVREALAVAHDAGLAHGHLCPGNILVAVRGDRGLPCLTDFALHFPSRGPFSPADDLRALDALGL